jgi:hypothetical protein
MTESWIQKFHDCLAREPRRVTALQMAERIHEALTIAEVEKYATPESRFGFVLEGATENEVAEIIRYLTPLERSIVEIERREGE